MKVVSITLSTGDAVNIDPRTRGTDLVRGDKYVARRNTGWELLTCDYLNTEFGYVVPKESAYYYDFHECYKVVS